MLYFRDVEQAIEAVAFAAVEVKASLLPDDTPAAVAGVFYNALLCEDVFNSYVHGQPDQEAYIFSDERSSAFRNHLKSEVKDWLKYGEGRRLRGGMLFTLGCGGKKYLRPPERQAVALVLCSTARAFIRGGA
jgi:hypothetical protein